MAKLYTPLCDQLGIRLPIIQAPMAGGPSTPELVAAVSQAGGLGSFGFAYTQPETMQHDVEAVRARTHLPFNLNLFASPASGAIAPDAQRGAINAVAGYFTELGLPQPEPVRPPTCRTSTRSSPQRKICARRCSHFTSAICAPSGSAASSRSV